MDLDTTRTRNAYERIISDFSSGKTNLLIGTQMISKGLNFENVTLVGIISADQSLYAGDYKAEERCFSLLTQIIGRSGRAKIPGRAVIQTFTPDNPVIRFASAQDYDSFYEHEISFRKLQGSPPFSEIFSLTVSGLSEDAVLKAVAYLRSYLINKKSIPDLRGLGPSPMPVYRLNRRYRHRLYLYTNRASELRKLLSDVLVYCRSESLFKGVSVYAEQNPSD
jgi:primosomal protein N' (replication factor Y)